MNTCDAGGFPPGEVSGPGTVFPLKIVKDSASCASGFCLEFEKETSATGYNIYEGTLGSWYSHGGAAGNVCDGTVTDLGANRMRVSLAPSGGDHYYVVTALNTFGEGTAGNPASDAQCSCPP
jgi:hypothetical protein